VSSSEILRLVILFLAAYMIGNINPAIILGKLKGIDIRKEGSGNAGMTNMLRTYGKLSAAGTLAGDALNAVISVLIGRLVWGAVGAYAAGLACVLGHVFPVFYRFKGGKGVVVSMVTILMTNWKVGLILLLFFVILVASTKFISLGSVMCALIYPLLLSRMNTNSQEPQIVMVFAFAITVIIVVLHRSNIKRLIEGKENKLSFSRKDKKLKDDGKGSGQE